MSRRFREHDLRQVKKLNGLWDFTFLGDVDPYDVDVKALEFDDRMAVPGCFDATPAYAGMRGLTAYRTWILLADEVPHRLVFDGVNNWCRVFVGGNMIRDHASGFTRFAADITGFPRGETDLVVLVDNRFHDQRAPLHLEYYDWYHHGGIARGVALHRLGGLWIDALTVQTKDLKQRSVELSVNYGSLRTPGRTPLTITCDGQIVLSENVELDTESGSVRRTLNIPWAHLWSPREPKLHLLHVRLGDDDSRERIGIRQVSTSGQQILINGAPVRLLGFNRHEMHPHFGHALPDSLLATDIQILRDLGCNFVRGSHYPQDLRFLDLCDEAGICVWNEAIGWHQNAEQLTNPIFMNTLGANIDEMVAMSRNRPSVIVWGVLNESHSDDPACRPAYERLLGHLRRLDPTRPVTYACNRPLTDICLDLVDIVSVNRYPGWYYGEIDEIPRYLDEYVTHLDASGQSDKPMIFSEIGAGAIRGWRDMNQARWSEQYQAKLLDTVIRHLFVERERVCGLSIWQYCDTRTSETGEEILGRPRAYNNKGVVDEYRRPKSAYDTVKRHFRALNGASIGSPQD